MIVSTSVRTLMERLPDKPRMVWESRLSWKLGRHSGQLPPDGDWNGWLVQAGRGFGKTLTGSFDAAEHCLDNSNYRYGVIAPTLGDVRDTCIEGETGIYQVLTEGTDTYRGMHLHEGTDFEYNRSLLEVEFPNKSRIKGYGAEKPDRLRGPQHHRLWFEELAAFKDAPKGDALQTAFNNAKLGLRLGETAQWIGTSTPRYNQLILDITKDENVIVTRGTTYDNLKNLSENFLETILVYEGTPLERQELLGEIVEITGTMFKRHHFHFAERVGDLLHLADGQTISLLECSMFITVDPAISTKDTADYTVFVIWARHPETGIKVVLEVVRDRLEAPEIVDTGAALLRKHRASWIGFEAVAYQTALIQFSKRRGLPAVPLKADKDKVTRSMPLLSQMKNRMIQFVSGTEWLSELEAELLLFPEGPHDDQVDALAYGAVEDRIRRTLTAY